MRDSYTISSITRYTNVIYTKIQRKRKDIGTFWKYSRKAKRYHMSQIPRETLSVVIDGRDFRRRLAVRDNAYSPLTSGGHEVITAAW